MLTHTTSVSVFRNIAYAAPYLSKEEERALLMKAQLNNCAVSVRKLAESHFRYIAKVARKFTSYGVEFEDLLQHGCIGVLKAIVAFDLKSDVRFITFAMIHIKAEITLFVMDNVRSYRIATTKSQRKLFFNLNHYRAVNGQYLTADEVKMIASELDVSEADVRQMEAKLRAADASIDDEAHASLTSTLEYHADPANDVIEERWEAQAVKKIHEAIKTLNPIEQDVFYHRVVVEDKHPLRELAERHNVSAERIRQIEKKATKKIRQLVQQFS